MKTNERASFQVLKITIVTLILMLVFSVAVRAFNSELNSVKIILANNYRYVKMVRQKSPPMPTHYLFLRKRYYGIMFSLVRWKRKRK